MSKYDSNFIEKCWQDMWKKEGIYHFDQESNGPIYSIDNPPRYTSGPLHLGHAIGYSIIDFIARFKRMNGYNVFFPLCFDVNGTPIEVKVEKKYHITKLDTSRYRYRKLCKEYADGFIEQMTHDFEILGESMDSSIYYRTDSPEYRRITQLSFIELFNKGLIYKANFPVNWCPRCMTALADAEVEYKHNINKLNYIKFRIHDKDQENKYVEVATTRPELLCTCKAIAINPNDKEKLHLIGNEVITPIFNRKIKIISDPKVQMDYGTGSVMICTIGDKDDLEWVMKYHFKMEKGIDEMGNMTELAGKYVGMSVLMARDMIINDLRSAGLLVRQEDNHQQISTCWRCHTPIEFLQVPQWFLKTIDFKDQILKRASEINWFPNFMKSRLEDWVNSIEWDWVLSRQRIFATPIPIWECKDCGHAICATADQCYVDPTSDNPPMDKCPECGGMLVGCTDVFDTWMDSSGSSLYNTFWCRDQIMHKKLFPMSLRPQSHDIIRTWAFYSILRTEQIKEAIPWKDVIIHGFIMAPDGTPMHSSIGNIIDPIPIIQSYGADALRYYASTCSLGIDHIFREKDVIRGRRLCNKLFNLGQFIRRFLDGVPKNPPELRLSDRWIISKFTKTLSSVTEYFSKYEFDKAIKQIEFFIWHEFADNYTEIAKTRSDPAVKYTIYNVFLGSIKILAPFIPHITEDIYQGCFRHIDGHKSIHLTSWPKPMFMDDSIETGDILKEVLAAIRTWKSKNSMPLNAEISMIELVGSDAIILDPAKMDILDTTKANEVRITSKAELFEDIVSIKPIYSKLGPKFKSKAKDIALILESMNPVDITQALINGSIRVHISGNDILIGPEFFDLNKHLTLNGKSVDTIQVKNILILIER